MKGRCYEFSYQNYVDSTGETLENGSLYANVTNLFCLLMSNHVPIVRRIKFHVIARDMLSDEAKSKILGKGQENYLVPQIEKALKLTLFTQSFT